MVDLNKEIKYVKGVGPNREVLLNKLKIYTLKDLITYYPRDYEDRSKPKNIYECEDGEEVLIEAMPTGKISEYRKGKMVISRLIVKDQTGTCYITWFNQGYLKSVFSPGRLYRFFGKVAKKGNRIEMNSPVYDEIDQSKNTGKIIPIYPLTYELKQNTLRKIMENGLTEVFGKLDETLPEYLLKENNLLDINTCIERIHFPHEFSDFNKARERLVFEELLITQLALLKLKNNYDKDRNGIKFDKNVKMSDVINKLPFNLTKAQLRVLEEIDNDMESPHSMNRLLQGDVGSGKTIVAMIAAYKAVKSGYQVAIMAPTAILASQHLESFESILNQFGIRCELLISSITKKKKMELLKRLQNGEIDILIGTHAILEENVIFKNLGLVVTDEQHRFGVRQREMLAQKGEEPHVLVMTATPIPRTLALILYGDLDISTINELPPGRQKVDTFAVNHTYDNRLYAFIEKEVAKGRQCYIICPMIEENEKLDLRSVLKFTEELQNDRLPSLRVECMHGKLKNNEKQDIMDRFSNGEIDVLVSTTVIEVGVNVPNATLMIIENAERFGLSALHQLRGRVGRGGEKSYCVLVTDSKTKVAKERMTIMCKSNDGFVISEKDLHLRGPGDFFGTRQHGLPEMKIANLYKDINILKDVQSVAIDLYKSDENLEKKENLLLKKRIEELYSEENKKICL